MDGHEFQVIVALASTLWGGTVAVIGYLLKQNEKLERRLEETTKAAAGSNEVNARLAALVPSLYARVEALSATPVVDS